MIEDEQHGWMSSSFVLGILSGTTMQGSYVGIMKHVQHKSELQSKSNKTSLTNIKHNAIWQCALWLDKLALVRHTVLEAAEAWKPACIYTKSSFIRNPGHHNVNIPTCFLCSQVSPMYCSKAMSSRSSSKCPSATTMPVSSFKDLDLPSIPQGKQRC